MQASSQQRPDSPVRCVARCHATKAARLSNMERGSTGIRNSVASQTLPVMLVETHLLPFVPLHDILRGRTSKVVEWLIGDHRGVWSVQHGGAVRLQCFVSVHHGRARRDIGLVATFAFWFFAAHPTCLQTSALTCSHRPSLHDDSAPAATRLGTYFNRV